VDVHTVLTGAHDMLAQLAGTAVRIDLHLDATETLIEADPRRIEQVLVNLVVNASDAMPNGGCLTLATANVHGWASDGHAASALQITVSDTGVGITPQVQRRIFEPFFTTKPPGSGTGLGLSTADAVVRRYGGTITVHSRLGEGTTFLVTLPLSERAPLHPDGAVAAGPEAGDPGTETILVVDDEAEVRVHVADALRGRGYRVLEAANGGAALDLVSRMPAPIDLLVSDIVMPGMGGPELADRIRALAPDARVLFVSGHEDIEPSSPRLRGTTLLRKPVRRAVLIAHVEQALVAGRT
jgi:CheY-like chemotaxis protein